MPPAERAVCAVLHDVAPATWTACRQLLEGIDALGRVPVTLLVVPEYHHGDAIDRVPDFVRAIEARLARGDEVVMHGCFHWDDVPAATPGAWLRRRFYTAGEGEFAALTQAQACARLARGLDIFRRLGWPVAGFVAPAWMMSAGTRAALAAFPFIYASTRRRIHTLPEWRSLAAASLVWSVRSAWRRAAFGALNRLLLRRQRAAPLLRLGMHPVDAGHAGVKDFWVETLRASLETRVPMTKGAWVAAQRAAAAR